MVVVVVVVVCFFCLKDPFGVHSNSVTTTRLEISSNVV